MFPRTLCGGFFLGTTIHCVAPKVKIMDRGAWYVAAFDMSSFAIADDTLFGWGRNHLGQLGLGDTNDRPVPTAIGKVTSPVGVGFDWIMINRDGEVYGWGKNTAGTLALGDWENRMSSVILEHPVLAMDGGIAHSLLLYDDLSLWAVGHDAHGSLGARVIGSAHTSTPVQVFPPQSIRPMNFSSVLLSIDSSSDISSSSTISSLAAAIAVSPLALLLP